MRVNLIVTRNFLYRLFVIGFVVNVLAQMVFMVAAKGQGIVEMATILNITPFFVGAIITASLVVMRMIFLYFVLFPALALHWTIARDTDV